VSKRDDVTARKEIKWKLNRISKIYIIAIIAKIFTNDLAFRLRLKTL
jgi:hypothetical protein